MLKVKKIWIEISKILVENIQKINVVMCGRLDDVNLEKKSGDNNKPLLCK